MDFDQLKTFIEKSMRMSHIYQPVTVAKLTQCQIQHQHTADNG